MLIGALMILLTCSAAATTAFPPDDYGMEVIDRAFCRSFLETGEAILYLRMYNSEGGGTIEMFKYSEDHGNEGWDQVFVWEPSYGPDEPVTFQPVSVITLQEDGGLLTVSWTGMVVLEYIEGLGGFYLEYDLNTGEISRDIMYD